MRGAAQRGLAWLGLAWLGLALGATLEPSRFGYIRYLAFRVVKGSREGQRLGW